MSGGYDRVLDHVAGVMLRVAFKTSGRDVTDYSIVLLVLVGERLETVRVYDGAHGFNEMHRFTSDAGKQVATRFHPGTLGEGMRAAIEEVDRSYEAMIEGWE